MLTVILQRLDHGLPRAAFCDVGLFLLQWRRAAPEAWLLTEMRLLLHQLIEEQGLSLQVPVLLFERLHSPSRMVNTVAGYCQRAQSQEELLRHCTKNNLLLLSKFENSCT